MPDPVTTGLLVFVIGKLFYLTYKVGRLETKVELIYNTINNVYKKEDKRR